MIKFSCVSFEQLHAFNGRGAEHGDATCCLSVTAPRERFEPSGRVVVEGQCRSGSEEKQKRKRRRRKRRVLGGRQKKQMMHALSKMDTSASIGFLEFTWHARRQRLLPTNSHSHRLQKASGNLHQRWYTCYARDIPLVRQESGTRSHR
jgi:hypothetical protein